MLSDYIRSFRLRTLPLSVSGIVLGTGMAWQGMAWREITAKQWVILIFAVLTTLALQVLANLCNELGDARKGTDSDQQGRVAYGLQTGAITERQMLRCIYSFVCLSVLFGTLLVFFSFGTLFSWQALAFLGLGALAIAGSVTYTLGKHPYGYHGLGDLGVFLFFGLLSTMGSYYLQQQMLTWQVVVAAVAISGPIIGVLNLNNIRDMQHDLQYGKRTLATRLGATGARVYQAVLLLGSIALFISIHAYYSLIVLPVFLHHIYYIFRHQGSSIDKLLPVLSLSTLLLSFLTCI